MTSKMKGDLTRDRVFPTKPHCGALQVWLLASFGVVLLLSCATPPTGGQGVTPCAATSSPVVSTAGLVTANVTPTATAGSVIIGTPSTTAPVQVETATTGGVPVYDYGIVSVFPHDRGAFTEGLVFEDGTLYEGTGLRGESTLRRVDLGTGEVLQLHSLPPQYFGEGITIWKDRIVQLTWQERTAFVYDKDSFELLHTFYCPTEGWGITHDGTWLIKSDGTSTLYFLDPESMEQIGQVQVYDDQGPVTMLNELEYVRGQVYANVWKTDRIAMIDPWTGQVTGWIELEGLLEPADYEQGVDVLNGIAYDPEGDRLFVTGKRWPKLFEIELVAPGAGGE
jgi:glutamine cyclotransferase